MTTAVKRSFYCHCEDPALDAGDAAISILNLGNINNLRSNLDKAEVRILHEPEGCD